MLKSASNAHRNASYCAGEQRTSRLGRLGRAWNRLFRAASAAAPLTPCVRAAVEALEARQMMSVSLNSAGFTVVTPSAADHVIYVSTAGNDANSGLSASAPVQSIAKAESLMRTGFGDEMLLQRGDVWHASLGMWTKSGASDQDPMVIGAYGTGARPLLDTGLNDGIITGSASHPEVDHLDIIGVSFFSDGRSPTTPGANVDANLDGIELPTISEGILIEDDQVQGYTTNINIAPYYGDVTNLTIRRCDVLDAWSATAVHSEGLFAEGVHGLTLQDNVFDHNGWNPSVAGAVPTMFNHDAYLYYDDTGVVVTDNVFSNASSHGLQARSGGIVENNLFVNDAIALSYGLVNGCTATPGGVAGVVSGNVVIGGTNIGSLSRGGGFEIGNTAAGGHTTVSNNLFIDGMSNAGMAAINLEIGANNTNESSTVGINNLTISNNVIDGWTDGLFADGNLLPGGVGPNAIKGVVIANNAFQQMTGPYVVENLAPLTAAGETFSGNTYSFAGAGGFNVKGNNVSWAQWTASYEATARQASLAFPNASLTLGSYDARLGGANSINAFIAAARNESSQTWNPAYTASAANAYLQAGFGIGSPVTQTTTITPSVTPAPTPTAAPTPTPTVAPTPTQTATPAPTPAATVAPPIITNVQFYQTSKTLPQYLMVQFNQDVANTIQTGDLVLTGPSGVVPASKLWLYYNQQTHTAYWEFLGYSGHALPKGTYHVTVLGTHIHNSQGEYLDGAYNGKAGTTFNWTFTFTSAGPTA